MTTTIPLLRGSCLLALMVSVVGDWSLDSSVVISNPSVTAAEPAFRLVQIDVDAGNSGQLNSYDNFIP